MFWRLHGSQRPQNDVAGRVIEVVCIALIPRFTCLINLSLFGVGVDGHKNTGASHSAYLVL